MAAIPHGPGGAGLRSAERTAPGEFDWPAATAADPGKGKKGLDNTDEAFEESEMTLRDIEMKPK